VILCPVLAGILAGCASGGRPTRTVRPETPAKPIGPPFAANARLDDSELDWFVKKALAWVQKDRDAEPGKPTPPPGTVGGAAIDRSRAIEREQSADGTVVTVSIPQRIEANVQYWMVVYLDAQTGDVRSSGAKRVDLNH